MLIKHYAFSIVSFQQGAPFEKKLPKSVGQTVLIILDFYCIALFFLFRGC